MYCTNCGARIGDVNFCQRCGAAVKHDDEDTGTRRRYDDEEAPGRKWHEPASRGFGAARRKAEEYVRDPRRTQELLTTALNKANARRGDQKLMDEIWDYLQTAARLVQASVRGEYTGLSGKNLTLIIAAILYYVSPIDIIPDFLPVAGLLDDVSILAFALRSIKGEIETFREWEREQARGTPTP